jgi:D-alanyl-D-alanine carboxypeptidase (penicillin-binding protein 5/6)
MPRKARRQMKVSITYEGPVPAPVSLGQPLAKLVVTALGGEPIEARLVAGENVERLGLLGRLGAALNYILWGVSG